MANAAIFISAGFETTASTLQFFFYLMAIYPDIQDKVYAQSHFFLPTIFSSAC